MKKPRATLICWKDSKILLVRRNPDKWSLPGGGIRSGESPLQAAARELREETSLVATRLVPLFRVYGPNRIHHIFQAYGAGGVACAGNEIARCAWVDPADAVGLHMGQVTRLLVERCLQARSDARHEQAVPGDQAGGPVR